MTARVAMALLDLCAVQISAVADPPAAPTIDPSTRGVVRLRGTSGGRLPREVQP